jgi:hypothetical protein
MRGASRTGSGTRLLLAAPAVLAVLSLSGLYLGGYLQQPPPSNGRPGDAYLARRAATGPTPRIGSNTSYHVRLGKAKARHALEQAFRSDLAARAQPPGLSWVVSAVALGQGRADVELVRLRGPPMLSV